MELITSLWDSGILGGIATMIVTIVGQLSALNTQKFTAVLETLQKQQTADVAATMPPLLVAETEAYL